ncbi:MAG: hypothetical protein GY769_08015 [bacterium]|nr:hypothetical protein [bacterium]
MNPKEREELLLEQRRAEAKEDVKEEESRALVPSSSVVLEPELVENVQGQDELEFRRREERAKEAEARKKPLLRLAGVMAGCVELYRTALDPRVLLDAAEVGVSEAEMDKMRQNMDTWAKAVIEERESEDHVQRRKRLRELRERLFPKPPPPGCGCRGTGFTFHEGVTLVSKDGVSYKEMDTVRMCSCEKGDGKRRFYKTMGLPRGRRGGRQGRSPKDSGEVDW